QRQRLRVDEIDDALEEVRSLLRERGRGRTQWEVGSSAEPADLPERLLERGLVHDSDPYAVALVLTREPPPPPQDIVARRGETLDEFAAACAVRWEAFGTTPAEIDEQRTMLPERWRETVNVCHAAWLDGQIVAAGTAAPTEHGLLLYGGATL